MAFSVNFSDDPAAVLARAGEALAARPVDANVVLTLLHTRLTAPAPGRFWVVADGAEVVGVVFQSPLTFFATLTPMSRKAVVAVVDVIADAGVDLPGVIGDAATAASFAGQWTERRESAAEPAMGQRIYEVELVDPPAATTEPVAGVARIGAVYTPVDRRRRGYAGACVAAVSAGVLAAGRRCILYTDLGNPTSNSVYRRIGYRAVAECLRYRFT